MTMPNNTTEAISYVVTATFASETERSNPERRTFVFEKQTSLETVFNTIFPVKGSINDMLFKPPVCVEISPDLTTTPPDEYSNIFGVEEKETL